MGKKAKHSGYDSGVEISEREGLKERERERERECVFVLVCEYCSHSVHGMGLSKCLLWVCVVNIRNDAEEGEASLLSFFPPLPHRESVPFINVL